MDQDAKKFGSAPGTEAVGESAANLGRRALLRGGAASAPVLLSFVSRPVSAANSCVVASSFVSVATFRSRNPVSTSAQCTTRNVEDWYRDAILPEVGTPARPAFLADSVATLLGPTSSAASSKALWQVLKNDPYGVTQAGETGALQHLIALTLNLQKGYAPPVGNLTVAYLKTVWSNYVGNGGRYVLPASGINWDTAQLVAWMRVLMYPMPA